MDASPRLARRKEPIIERTNTHDDLTAAHRRDLLVQLRPRAGLLYVSQGRSVLTTGLDGFIDGQGEQGLFVHRTRLLSRYCYLIDGKPPQVAAVSNVEQQSWLGYYLVPIAPEARQGQVGADAWQEALELRLSRFVTDGVHEDVDLTNYSRREVAYTLRLELDADFADTGELNGPRQQQGQLQREWRELGEGRWALVFDYQVEHAYDQQGERGRACLRRGLTVQVEQAGAPPVYQDGGLNFQVALASHETWHVCIKLVPLIDGVELAVIASCRAFMQSGDAHDPRRATFLNTATRFSSAESATLAYVVTGTLEQAKQDLSALRLSDLDHGERAWTMAAGLPIYLALYGRDTLTAAWQAALLSPAMMEGTLRELARWQGSAQNDWRDEQPGRMLHNAETGPLAMLNYHPFGRYYGAITTSAFYPTVVAELWHWTGDKALVEPLVEPALKALRWLDSSSDFDGDGFYEYQTRSRLGLKHQGWKDTPEALLYEDGTPAEPPIATCEEQGFVYVAKLHLAELLWWLDRKDEARQLFHQAQELKKRFNTAFWMPDEGFFAMGLDAQKRQIRSVGSNAGHCLATGIADQEFVLPVADRMLAPDLFSGWGVRTLSSEHPAYNPHSYHHGSVWPVEQGSFALGFLRYGLHEHAERLSRGVFEAAARFAFQRLPELFSGHQRDADHPFPALYPSANSPQAWASSTVFTALQSLLGLYPYAPLKLLLVDPHLPSWLPEITIRDLCVGQARVTLRFYQSAQGKSQYEVLEQHGTLHVLLQPSPWSISATLGERLIDALRSL